MKRIILFVATNLAVVLVLSVVLKLFGLDRALAAQGFQYGAAARLFARRRLHRRDHFAADVEDDGEVDDRRARDRDARATRPRRGWSKPCAGSRQARASRMPEVAIYEGDAERVRHRRVQEFGAGRRLDRPAAVDEQGRSRGGARPRDLARRQRRHGDADADPGRGQHVRVFLSRIVGSIVDRTVFRTERGTGPGYFITVIVCQIVFGILASLIVAWFSRWREFRADAGSARLLGAAADGPRAARGSAASSRASCRRRCRRPASRAAAA